MDRRALHLEIRNALELSDELSRYEHALGAEELTAHLMALRSALEVLERDIGRSHAEASPLVFDRAASAQLRRSSSTLVLRKREVPRSLHDRLELLLASVERAAFGLEHPHEVARAKPVLAVLPLSRAVPQDVHTVIDYLAAAASLAGAMAARTRRARAVGLVMAAVGVGVAMTTDYRLRVVRPRLPIETHEKVDLAWGAALAAAPFVLRYARRDPIAAATQVAVGIAVMALAVVTDFRADRGITRPLVSRGGPAAHASTRPLEGLSSAFTDWPT